MDDSSNGGALDQGQVTLVEKSEFLQNWKTDFVSFILGLVVSWLLNVLLNNLEGYVWRSMEVAAVYFVDLIYLIFVVVFALKIYPSLFTDKPMLKSQKSASFLSAFTGGLIFGAIWCSALTKGKKGISQYVLCVLIAIGVVVVVFLNLNAASVVNSQSGNGVVQPTATPTLTSSGTRDYQVTGYTDGDAEEWYPASGSVTFSGKNVSFSASCNGKQYSGSGDFLDVEEGFDVYALRDGTYAAHGTAEGVRMLMVLTEDRVLYALLLE